MTDEGFLRFRDGMGGALVERAWNLDIRQVESWNSFRSLVRNFNVESDGAFFQRICEAESWLSCGERAVMLATLDALGFEGYAEALNDGCCLDQMYDTSEQHQEAFELAMQVNRKKPSRSL